VPEAIDIKDVNMPVVKLLAETGHTDQFLCKVLGIHIGTLNAWVKRYPDFKRAFTNWKKVACEQVEKSLFEHAVGFEYEREQVFVNKIKQVRYEENEDGGRPVRVETEKVVATKVPIKVVEPPDFQSAKFFLINQKGNEWKDKTEALHDVTGTLADAIQRARGRSIEANDDMEFLK
jgi:hypothetical protein